MNTITENIDLSVHELCAWDSDYSSEEEVNPDTEMAKSFLDSLEPKGIFTFQTFSDQKDQAGATLNKILHGTFEEHVEELVSLNKGGAGVFVMINQGDGIIHEGRKSCRTNANVTGIRSLYIDLDVEAYTLLKQVMGCAPRPNLIVESSREKFHCYWLVKDCPVSRFSALQKQLINRFSSDKSVNDLARVMRLPGFYHHKNRPVMSRFRGDLSAFGGHHRVDDIAMHLLGGPVSALSGGVAQPRQIPRGQRNDTLFSIAGKLRREGVDQTGLIRHLSLINQASCTPPLDNDEVLSIANSVSRYNPAQQNTVYLLNDTGNADRFAKRYSGTVKYVTDWKKFIIFNGTYWEVDRSEQVTELAKNVARDIYREGDHVQDTKLRESIVTFSNTSQNSYRLTAMCRLCQSIPSIAIHSSSLNTNKLLLAVKNGVIDLTDGSFRGGRREDFITQVAPVEYDPEAQCPHFLQFIQDTFIRGTYDKAEEDQELLNFVHKALGYSLTGETSEQCLFFFYGSGANGKTTLINVMLSLLGSDYSAQTPMDTLAIKNTASSSSNDLARLQNIRFVAATETEDNSRLAESLIKQLTGGDKIACRYLYQEYFEFQPRFKLFMSGNHKPIIKGSDEGIWRRIYLVPFEITVPESRRNPELPRLLASELPGILNWLIKGCIDWQKHGLKVPKRISNAVSEYKEEMDTLGSWISDCCVVEDGARLQGKDAYKVYRKWSENNGFQPSCSNSFGRKLAERFDKKRTSSGILYSGIKLKFSCTTDY